ncbi:MAG: aminotransferase class I/II-fold pyridoxal phosphate-dependent enzyme [Deltaproteobacteria bacterium]|nr:aminotransferase class I/II-fold pyridoxal phosphate-dependent enzyme [Deltaproteobacteria bacterium]
MERETQIKETVIRRMTRLAAAHGAVNLAQGFTDETPAWDMVWSGVAALLGGTGEGARRVESLTVRELLAANATANATATGDADAGADALDRSVKELFEQWRGSRDEFNQYSYPFGLPELRHAIADYTQTCHGYRPDPEEQITVVLGASEGMAAAFRSLLAPGDGVVVMQPYHELYPSQAAIFGLVPRFVTLREDRRVGTWRLDRDELRTALSDPAVKAVVVNTPQNPTGKVLDAADLEFIAELCRTHDRFAITDEIYEHITFDGHRHRCLALCEGMAERTLVVNSISKTGRATGWRIGWVITPPDCTPALRAVHDNLVVQAPTPLQKGAVSLLRQPRSFFAGIAEGYREKRDLLVGGLREAGFAVTPPEGAYYLFADYRAVPALTGMSPTQAAMFLIEQAGVATVPGDNFYTTGREGDRYLRFAFCRSLDTLQEAVARLHTRLR